MCLCCSVLQCVAVCCKVLQCVGIREKWFVLYVCDCITLQHTTKHCNTVALAFRDEVGSGSWGKCVPATDCNTPTMALAFCDGIREKWFVVCVCDCNTLQ